MEFEILQMMGASPNRELCNDCITSNNETSKFADQRQRYSENGKNNIWHKINLPQLRQHGTETLFLNPMVLLLDAVNFLSVRKKRRVRNFKDMKITSGLPTKFTLKKDRKNWKGGNLNKWFWKHMESFLYKNAFRYYNCWCFKWIYNLTVYS